MYLQRQWAPAEVYMESFQDSKSLISIHKSVQQHIDVIPSLIAIHALSGCDSVPMMFGIGKAKALAAAKYVQLQYLGHEDASLNDVLLESKRFVAKCYGQNETSSSKNRLLLWTRKTDGAKLSAKPPTLRSLPPTDEALQLNIKRAHFQAMMWNNCTSGKPPRMDPCNVSMHFYIRKTCCVQKKIYFLPIDTQAIK